MEQNGESLWSFDTISYKIDELLMCCYFRFLEEL